MKWASCFRDCFSMASICIVVTLTFPCWIPYSLFMFCRHRQCWFFDTSSSQPPTDDQSTHRNNTHLPVEPSQNYERENLEQRLESVAKTNNFDCKICCTNETEHQIVFNPCGHSCCSKCAAQLSSCHVCRHQILNKIRLYN